MSEEQSVRLEYRGKRRGVMLSAISINSSVFREKHVAKDQSIRRKRRSPTVCLNSNSGSLKYTAKSLAHTNKVRILSGFKLKQTLWKYVTSTLFRSLQVADVCQSTEASPKLEFMGGVPKESLFVLVLLQSVGLIGSFVTGTLARKRRIAMEKMNEQLRSINNDLRAKQKLESMLAVQEDPDSKTDLEEGRRSGIRIRENET